MLTSLFLQGGVYIDAIAEHAELIHLTLTIENTELNRRKRPHATEMQQMCVCYIYKYIFLFSLAYCSGEMETAD